MEAIKAFVGRSFTDDDAGTVTPILNYLNGLAELHPNFSWQDAEHPEPAVIDAKVFALFKDKNLFIGICTRKERAIADGVLKPLWLRRGSLASDKANFQWKTSDWIIQEIGLAIGLGLDLVLLVEEGVRPPGALQGNIERIPFNRDAPEKCFNKLVQMIASLSPKVGSDRGAAQESGAAAIPEKEEPGLTLGDDWTTQTRVDEE